MLSIFGKKNTNFVFSHFISGTIAFGVLHTSLICCVLIQYFKDAGMLPLQLSIIIISKRVLRLFCDTLFGLIFDRFGAKVVFLLGRLLKLTGYFIMLYFPTFEGFVLAMLLDGASYSSIYGKISSYIYNNLSVRRELKLFPKAMSLYYFCMDITVAMMTFFAGLLLKTHGYNILIYISIFTNLFSIFLLIRLVPNGNNKDFSAYKAKSFKSIFTTLRDVVRLKPQFIFLIFLYGVLSFLAWQFHSISSMILIDMGVSSVNVAMCGAVLKTIMAIGALVSIFIFSKGISILKCCFCLLFILFCGLISSITYNLYVFYLFCLLVVFAYTTMEVNIERNFEFFSDKKIRGTAISVAMTFCSMISILANMLIGFLAQHYGYKFALIVFMTILFIFVAFITYKLSDNNNNLSMPLE